MIVDAHRHAGEGDEMTALVSLFHADYARANANVARIVAKAPDSFVGFAFVRAKRDAGRILSIVRKAKDEWGFKGVKVHGREAMPMREVHEAARAPNLPILPDVADKPEVVDDWRAHQRAIEQLVRHTNVYSDTSGLRRFDCLVEAAKHAGPRNLIFASDAPWLHPGLELEKVKRLGLAPAALAAVTGGNIRRLLKAGPDAGRMGPITAPRAPRLAQRSWRTPHRP